MSVNKLSKSGLLKTASNAIPSIKEFQKKFKLLWFSLTESAICEKTWSWLWVLENWQQTILVKDGQQIDSSFWIVYGISYINFKEWNYYYVKGFKNKNWIQKFNLKINWKRVSKDYNWVDRLLVSNDWANYLLQASNSNWDTVFLYNWREQIVRLDEGTIYFNNVQLREDWLWFSGMLASRKRKEVVTVSSKFQQWRFTWYDVLTATYLEPVFSWGNIFWVLASPRADKHWNWGESIQIYNNQILFKKGWAIQADWVNTIKSIPKLGDVYYVGKINLIFDWLNLPPNYYDTYVTMNGNVIQWPLKESADESYLVKRLWKINWTKMNLPADPKYIIIDDKTYLKQFTKIF